MKAKYHPKRTGESNVDVHEDNYNECQLLGTDILPRYKVYQLAAAEQNATQFSSVELDPTENSELPLDKDGIAPDTNLLGKELTSVKLSPKVYNSYSDDTHIMNNTKYTTPEQENAAVFLSTAMVHKEETSLARSITTEPRTGAPCHEVDLSCKPEWSAHKAKQMMSRVKSSDHQKVAEDSSTEITNLNNTLYSTPAQEDTELQLTMPCVAETHLKTDCSKEQTNTTVNDINETEATPFYVVHCKEHTDMSNIRTPTLNKGSSEDHQKKLGYDLAVVQDTSNESLNTRQIADFSYHVPIQDENDVSLETSSISETEKPSILQEDAEIQNNLVTPTEKGILEERTLTNALEDTNTQNLGHQSLTTPVGPTAEHSSSLEVPFEEIRTSESANTSVNGIESVGNGSDDTKGYFAPNGESATDEEAIPGELTFYATLQEETTHPLSAPFSKITNCSTNKVVILEQQPSRSEKMPVEKDRSTEDEKSQIVEREIEDTRHVSTIHSPTGSIDATKVMENTVFNSALQEENNTVLSTASVDMTEIHSTNLVTTQEETNHKLTLKKAKSMDQSKVLSLGKVQSEKSEQATSDFDMASPEQEFRDEVENGALLQVENSLYSASSETEQKCSEIQSNCAEINFAGNDRPSARIEPAAIDSQTDICHIDVPKYIASAQEPHHDQFIIAHLNETEEIVESDRVTLSQNNDDQHSSEGTQADHSDINDRILELSINQECKDISNKIECKEKTRSPQVHTENDKTTQLPAAACDQSLNTPQAKDGPSQDENNVLLDTSSVCETEKPSILQENAQIQNSGATLTEKAVPHERNSLTTASEDITAQNVDHQSTVTSMCIKAEQPSSELSFGEIAALETSEFEDLSTKCEHKETKALPLNHGKNGKVADLESELSTDNNMAMVVESTTSAEINEVLLEVISETKEKLELSPRGNYIVNEIIKTAKQSACNNKSTRSEGTAEQENNNEEVPQTVIDRGPRELKNESSARNSETNSKTKCEERPALAILSGKEESTTQPTEYPNESQYMKAEAPVDDGKIPNGSQYGTPAQEESSVSKFLTKDGSNFKGNKMEGRQPKSLKKPIFPEQETTLNVISKEAEGKNHE